MQDTIEENHSLYLRSAIYVGNLFTLFSIWKNSLQQGETGRETRRLIKDSLPHIAEVNGVPFVLGMTFREVVESYDRKRVNECENREECLNAFVGEGNLYIVIYALSRYVNINYSQPISIAIERGYTKIATILIIDYVNSIFDSWPDSTYNTDMYVFLV
jgi:hypothetical protein